MGTQKISDGDLVVITYDESINEYRLESLVEEIEAWIKKRGLNDVDIVQKRIFSGKGDHFNVSVFSVNDVFEDQVLKR